METDSWSYSFPDLAKAEGKSSEEADHHPQQGSDPNLLSDSYQDRIPRKETGSLLSATNELQGSSGLVHQQLPMKLSSLASTHPSSTSGSKPQQMIPTKLSSLSMRSSSPSTATRNGNRMSAGSAKSYQGSSKMNSKRGQGAEQDVIFF
ncbi:uncharacterized protein LOC119718851 [Patiria miniata]|uniref:Uncharacterized protein n=1 Tax=Patiria miniata TaxID=46514 RepID=A0A913YXD4_PATMI|nr:uncharacterized protein LOC119718851 [Patiria miniata]